MYSIDYGYIYVCCSVQGYVFLLKIEGLLFSVFLAPRKLRILMYELCVQLPLLSTYMNWLHTKHFLAFFVK